MYSMYIFVFSAKFVIAVLWEKPPTRFSVSAQKDYRVIFICNKGKTQRFIDVLKNKCMENKTASFFFKFIFVHPYTHFIVPMPPPDVDTSYKMGTNTHACVHKDITLI